MKIKQALFTAGYSSFILMISRPSKTAPVMTGLSIPAIR